MLELQSLGYLAAFGVAALFAASAFAKATYWQPTLEWFYELFPKIRPWKTTTAAVGTEVVLLAALIAIPKIGAIFAALFLLLASAVLIDGKRKIDACGCFGKRQQLGMGVAIRNGVAIVTAGVAAWLTPLGLSPYAEVFGAAALLGVIVIVWREAIDQRKVVTV